MAQTLARSATRSFALAPRGILRQNLPMSLRVSIAIAALATAHAAAETPAWWQRMADALGIQPQAPQGDPPIELFDPAGKAAPWIAGMGLPCRAWDGNERAALLVIGPDALSGAEPMPGDIEKFVAVGGKVLILPQDPVWLAEFVGMEPSSQPCVRSGPGDPAQAIARGLSSEALGGWPAPIARSPIRLPSRGGWHSLLDATGQAGYSILMEADYGWGRLTLCAIDFLGAASHEPATALARRVISHAARASQATAPTWRADRDANRRLFDPAPPDQAKGNGFYIRASVTP